MWVFPHLFELITHIWLLKIIQKNAETLTIRKLRIVAALAGEIGIDLKTMAHITHHNERWPLVAGWQMPCIVFGLLPSVQHQHIPSSCARSALSGAISGRKHIVLAFNRLLAALGAGLFGFENETAAFIEINKVSGLVATQRIFKLVVTVLGAGDSQ